MIALVSIIVPTIDGRQDELVRTVSAFERRSPAFIEWIVETGHDNCGAAWHAGARRATSDHLLMAADDLEPSSPAWLPAAIEAVELGHVPVGWVREAAGQFGRDFPRVPFCRREDWIDVPECHYYSDNAFGELQAREGRVACIAPGYDFIHRRSMVGRDETPERLARDRTVFEQAVSGLHHGS